MNQRKRRPQRAANIRQPDCPTPQTARQLSFAVLQEHKATGVFVSNLIHERIERSQLSPADRRLVTELVNGIVRRKATVDAVLSRHVPRGQGQVEPDLWTVLQLGAYQLMYLTSVPAHAAIHETVELARWLQTPRWSGFINGALRGLQRGLTDEQTDEPAADAFPVADGHYRKLTDACFDDPLTDPVDYFVRAFSFPRWLTRRWHRRFGADQTRRVGFWFNTPPRICLRVNPLRAGREQLLTALHEAGIEAELGTHPQAIRLLGSAQIDALPGFGEGWFSVQDESAMHCASLLAPKPGDHVLDLCAAPGTKTTHLAELMNNTGHIIATDIGGERLWRVTDNCDRLGIECVETAVIARDGSDIPEGPFDAVLLDAPCSNTGVMARRPEARWRLREEDVGELAEIQGRLLTQAIERLKPGGRLVYSTCSIEPDENADVVAQTCSAMPNVRQIESNEYVPGFPGDGGFQALLIRD